MYRSAHIQNNLISANILKRQLYTRKGRWIWTLNCVRVSVSVWAHITHSIRFSVPLWMRNNLNMSWLLSLTLFFRFLRPQTDCIRCERKLIPSTNWMVEKRGEQCLSFWCLCNRMSHPIHRIRDDREIITSKSTFEKQKIQTRALERMHKVETFLSFKCILVYSTCSMFTRQLKFGLLLFKTFQMRFFIRSCLLTFTMVFPFSARSFDYPGRHYYWGGSSGSGIVIVLLTSSLSRENAYFPYEWHRIIQTCTLHIAIYVDCRREQQQQHQHCHTTVIILPISMTERGIHCIDNGLPSRCLENTFSVIIIIFSCSHFQR